MNTRSAERALSRLAAPGAVLAPARAGPGYCVFPDGDRRRRPLARLGPAQVRELEAAGAITPCGEDGSYALTAPGRARVRRDAAGPGEGFAAQHRSIVERVIVDESGEARPVRGLEPSPVLRRLGALRDPAGAPWLSSTELSAAARLRADWEAEQAGLVRGSDWTAPPLSGGARGATNAQERVMAARCDARRRVAEALDRLAPALRRVVERVCICEEGLEALERAEGWPARSGKLALKLALAQLAAR